MSLTAAALTSLPSQLHIVLDWLFTLIECGYAVRNLYFDVEPSVVRSKDISLLLIVAICSTTLGCLIRFRCFRTLGDMFTFDPTIQPQGMVAQYHCQ